MNDLTVLKMHLIRDEQETMNQFLDEIGEIFDNPSSTLEELFDKPHYPVRFRLSDPLQENDE